ncbi:Xaa-Pro aminopeptidase [Lewinella marina]|uniref:Xaa-Pro aminopeptidase n=1 Tax=Neolewinella marina TaxID=438751 RepID=A0A2G0CEA1_9BACT|nr:aminopeptidase P family protein [Neolewinella marina]NJB87384.1 Xaa-Pro aminopeptidase [Neolewinella marina]PHK98304.1 Xaa-Pro aminopeptidase [Neolewinella marina]
MFPTQTYTDRRRRLAEALASGLILLPANAEAPMNYRGNTYPYRQDSSFRYFAGHNRPGLVLTIDAGSGESRLYGDDPTLDDIVWMGEQPLVKDLAQRVGAEYGGTLDQLRGQLAKAGTVHFLPPYREERRRQLREWLGEDRQASEALIRAVVELRAVKSAEEVAEMNQAVRTSLQMHEAAECATQAGMTEAEVAGLVEGLAISAGGRLGYPAIVTRNGHILHNHYHGNTLREGDLLLIDAGAEAPSGYTGDITRTFAVGGEMTDRQRAVYDIVDRAKSEAIAALRPGVAYREIHDQSARTIAAGLKELGLMKGSPEDAVAAGAHALFYPHGLGHLIGLDVHDMEDLGEDLVGYDDEFKRSSLFGTRNLRLGRRLREGFTLTVEPGIYFIPFLTDRWRAEGKHREFINYDALEAYRDFGGIRLEDDVLVGADGPTVLG